MTDKSNRRLIVLPSDITAQGNVTIWDFGPPAEMPPPDPPLAPDSDDYKRAVSQYEADCAKWHKANGPGPIPVTMHAADARAALVAAPERYALEPVDIDDAEVAAEIKEIQKRRAEAAQAAADAADRKTAIATVMNKRAAEAAKVAKDAPTPGPNVQTKPPVAPSHPPGVA